MHFWTEVLANFIASLSAGFVLFGGTYWFVTRRFEILRPAKERRARQVAVLRVIAEELSSCLIVATIHQDSKDELQMLDRFPTSKWEAARASESFRLLPPAVTAAVFAAYDLVSAFNRLADKIEAADFASWTSGDPSRSAAEIFRQNLVAHARPTSEAAARGCLAAIERVRSELASPTSTALW
jgi:hypothetical protein